MTTYSSIHSNIKHEDSNDMERNNDDSNDVEFNERMKLEKIKKILLLRNFLLLCIFTWIDYHL